MNPAQKDMAEITNKEKQTGTLTEIIKDKDVFIGVSAPNIVTAEWYLLWQTMRSFCHGKSNTRDHAR